MADCEERKHLLLLHRGALSDLTAMGKRLIDLAGCPEQVGEFDRALDEYEAMRKRCESLLKEIEFHTVQHQCGAVREPGGGC